MSATWVVRSRALPGLLLVAAALGACQGTRNAMDPTLQIRTPGGQELGVSTEYGVLFLGHTARSGEVQVVAWFGDGPSIELSVIEPLGDGLYTAETQIRLPTIPITFATPQPGAEVTVIGRHGSETWEATARVLSDPRVEGLLLTIPGELRNAADQVGAGIFVNDPDTGLRRLVALVSGRVELVSPDGQRTEYLTAMGPEQLWRLVARRQDLMQRRRWVYREDIL
jgi:hypothetical protein